MAASLPGIASFAGKGGEGGEGGYSSGMWAGPAAVMKAAYRAATTTGMIVMCAHVLAYFLVMTQVTEALLNWLKGAGVPRWGILIILSALKQQQQQLLAIVFSSPAAPSSAPAPHR